ncbi:MAG: acylphosphatase [Omnitrophica bacterium]|nr:acylphosphatase [Candidatus Omnitrophota bacterium]
MVQGVGFRWTAERIANSLGLTGWVRNCPDGTVEAVGEGQEEDINAFMNRIKNEMQPYIRSVRTDWEEPRGEFDTFTINFFSA